MSAPRDPLEHLGTVHLVVGLLTVVAFVLTGQYMDRAHDHLQDMEGTMRMLYRSTHLYILYAGLLNGVAGIGWRPYPDAAARWVRAAGSLLLLALPFLLLAAFMTEPAGTDLNRPYTRPATYAALGGATLLLAAHVLQRLADLRRP